MSFVHDKNNDQGIKDLRWTGESGSTGSVLSAHSSFPPRCHVAGALRLVLRVLRVLGAAPVSITSRGGRSRLEYRAGQALCSYVVAFTLIVVTVVCLFLDMISLKENSVRAINTMQTIIWILDVIVVVTTLISGICTSPKNTKQLIKVLNDLEKIELELRVQRCKRAESYQAGLVSAALIMSAALYAVDYFKVVWQAFKQERDWRIACSYITFYIMYFLGTLVTAQFIMIALTVNSTMRAVNDALEGKLRIADLQSDFYRSYLPAGAVNKKIDSLSCPGHIDQFSSCKYTSIRRLARHHGTLCDLVLALSCSHSAILITLVVGFLLHLVITPYYLLVIVFSRVEDRTETMMLQSIWCIYHSLNMLAVIEPCHGTTAQVRRTKELLSQLMRRVSSSSEPLLEQVSLFVSQLSISTVEYSPYGFCVLHRPLIATILGGVTTYLVIVIQFQYM